MIDLYKLQQFVAFAKHGTLQSTAEIFGITQPALSRNMKALEDEIGVSLFSRQKNKLTLNDNGKLLLSGAEKLLADADALAQNILVFDKQNMPTSIGLCTLGAIWKLYSFVYDNSDDVSTSVKVEQESLLLNKLINGQYDLIVTSFDPEDDDLYTKALCDDNLLVALPNDHKNAVSSKVTFCDIDGDDILIMPNYGCWEEVLRNNLPHSRFITKKTRAEIETAMNTTKHPLFLTNLVVQFFGFHFDRVLIPVYDDPSRLKYYISCHKDNYAKYKTLFDNM